MAALLVRRQPLDFDEALHKPMRMILLPRLAALALTLLLASCGQTAAPLPTTAPASSTTPVVTTIPTATPTTAPTGAPAATSTLAPTETPAAPEPTASPAAVLPAPLLFINEGNELARMDVDGKTVTTLTDEASLIIDFGVAPNSGPIAYLTVATEDQTTTLVRISADGRERTELASGILRGVTLATDGSVQAGVVGEAAAIGGGALEPGAWNFPFGGGEPTLLTAATEPTRAADGTVTPGVHFQPLAWSPDGSKLLLRLTLNAGPDAPAGDISSTGLAVYDVGSIRTRELLPLGKEPLCVQPAWAHTSTTLFCANAASIGAPTPALWRLNLADGTQETIIPAAEPITAVLSPADRLEGLYVLVGTYGGSGLQLMPHRIGPDGLVVAQLPLPVEAGFDGGLWAPDGSGFVYGRPTASANRTITWQPLGEGSAVELLTGSIGRLEWATE